MSTATIVPIIKPSSLASGHKLGDRNWKMALIDRVMQQTDDLVLVLEYSDKSGVVTRRVVSPIRFLGGGRFLALCLSRQEPRQFCIDQCRSMRVDLAIRYVMPVELQEIE